MLSFKCKHGPWALIRRDQTIHHPRKIPALTCNHATNDCNPKGNKNSPNVIAKLLASISVKST